MSHDDVETATPSARRWRVARAAAALLGLSLCSTCAPTDTLGAWVPPTAAEDPWLPQRSVTVRGHTRALHLESFGDPANTPLLALHGGPGADFRLLLPLRALADRYFVVMWDQRGAGLSERVTAAELSPDAMVEELGAVHAAVAPARRVALLGHSYGGSIATRYTALHPDRVEQLVLIEPGPLTPAAQADYAGGRVNVFAPLGQDFFFQSEYLSPRDHAEIDYRVASVLREATRDFYCAGREPPAYPLWRYGGVSHHVLVHGSGAVRGYNWAEGIGAYAQPVLLVAGACGSAGAAVQRAHNVRAFARVELAVVDGAGHLTLFTDYASALLATLRSYLHAYR